MKISYNWLKEYVSVDMAPEEVARVLTDTGLEVEGIEKIEAVKGGLEGVYIGEVLTKEKHPDADRLNITTVNVGHDEPYTIVCGAPNVDAGQKVVVALPGTTLFPTGEEKGFTIKKAKIRGVESNGMICAEDELGIGESHDGIMVLEEAAKVGTEASSYFKLENDYMLEIGLTPNRSDGMSHIGVARDFAAAMSLKEATSWSMPDVSGFKVDDQSRTFKVTVEDTAACPRYAGLSISGVKVAPSPDWLQQRLRSIGLGSINNIVDVTNFVNHELGQPLHAFDGDKIADDHVIVKQLPQGTKFTTLDEAERELHAEDLMICDPNGGMCIAGVFGGIGSGVTDETTAVFLESAYFNPVSVRKTARRHGLNTDASYRFERGVDPNITIHAIKRAAMLIVEVAGGKITSEISDHYPEPIADHEVSFSLSQCTTLIGEEIPVDTIRNILKSLDIEIVSESGDTMELRVPPYRADVQRQADVVEEVLRIYGFNQVALPEKATTALVNNAGADQDALLNLISDMLSSRGFAEIMNSSLTNSAYAEIAEAKQYNADYHVPIMDPLSQEMDVMRQSLLFGGLEAIRHNINRQQYDLKFYEFGRIYQKFPDGYFENHRLAIFLSGKKAGESWFAPEGEVSFHQLRGAVDSVLQRLGIQRGQQMGAARSELFADGLEYKIGGKKVAEFGWVKPSILDKMEVGQNVFYAELDWEACMSLLHMNKVKYKEVSKFPTVRRDLSMLLDEEVSFLQIEEIARKCGKKLLRETDLFDIYKGKNLGKGKKSYAVSFRFRDDEKTMTDQQVDRIMEQIQKSVIEKLGAELR